MAAAEAPAAAGLLNGRSRTAASENVRRPPRPRGGRAVRDGGWRRVATKLSGTVHTWETYDAEQRRRALAEAGLAAENLGRPLHVAVLEGWSEEALAVLEAAVRRRGGVVRGSARTRAVAAGLGAYWQALRALQAAGAPADGWQLARALAGALERDGGAIDADMPCGDKLLPFGRRTAIMGILNVTPDSFSDGGHYFEKDAAVARGRELAWQGADVVDVGGESTRPGALPVDPEEELRRVVPVVEALAGTLAAPISVDTYRAAVAARALAAGAHMINDISALRFDPDMARVVAEHGCPVVLMHMQGTPRTMQERPVYGDVVADILDFLDDAVARAVRAGIARDRIIVDPGFGFGKTLEHNLEMMRNLRAFRLLGCPVLLGASRKTSLGSILLGAPPCQRDEGTAATVALAVAEGAHMVRVHDVAAMAKVARVADAVVAGRKPARVFLSLGSNMGDTRANLAEARRRLGALPGTRLVAASPLYRTEPVGGVEQDWFLNQVVELETYLDPIRLLGETQLIEAALGRPAVEKRIRWGPRPIDIDIVLYGEETVERPNLRIPHPESHKRRFVLQPLVDLDPGVRWLGKTAAEHLAALPPGQALERVAD